MYEKFSATSTESLDFIFIRLKKIVSQLAVFGEFISQQDLNLKFLRSLPCKWNTHVVVWRNKPDLDTISIDDLNNNFKIVEQEVKGTASSNSSSQNMAFVSSPCTNSTNEVHTAYGFNSASTQSSIASTQDCDVEETPPKAMVAIDGVSFHWSYMAEDDSYKHSSYGFFRLQVTIFLLVKDRVLDNKDFFVESPVVVEKKIVVPTIAKVEFIRPKQQENPANCNYHQMEWVVSGNNYTRVTYNNSTRKIHPSAYRKMAPRAVVMKTGLRPLNTARPVNTAHPKTTVYSARPMSYFLN
nr:hypothetical protein [Tanacetum cinerariifolium]